MAHISGFERDQLLLLPESVDDYVGSDNPVRFIDAFVDGLDLVAAGSRGWQPKATGRPGYAPGDLLKLYIYGYLNRVRSSRRLEAERHRNIEVIWLLRHAEARLQDHRRFPRRQSRRLQGGVSPVHAAVQASSICSAANCWRSTARGSRRSTTRIAISPAIRWTKFIKAGRRAAGRLPPAARRGRRRRERRPSGARVKNLAEKIEAIEQEARRDTTAMLKQLERTGEDQISLTDPDSRAMAAHTRVAVGYNAQVAVDAKNKLIVAQEVTNQVVDMGLLQATAEPAREILEVGTDRCRRRRGLLQDRGYRGLRGGGADAARAPATARLVGRQRLLSQGRISLRLRAGRLRLSGRSRTEAVSLKASYAR